MVTEICPSCGGTCFLWKRGYLKSHTVGELGLFFAHKVLFLSLSVGRRHRREPGLTGLWRILLVLQDDFHTPGPLSDNDLIQQSEGSHGSSRPCTLSGERTEGAKKNVQTKLALHFFTTRLYRSFDLVVECDIYPQDTNDTLQEDKEKMWHYCHRKYMELLVNGNTSQ